MRSGEKYELVKCIETSALVNHIHKARTVAATVLEVSILVNMTKPNKKQTSNGYCWEMFLLQVRRCIREYGAQRIDINFDTY